jgi:hypothetical protein
MCAHAVGALVRPQPKEGRMVVMVPDASVAEAARTLGVTPQRVRQILAASQLRYQQTSLGRLIDPDDLERLGREREERQRRDHDNH